MPQPFQPYHRLSNRTFVGLIIAQFLAAFNDQCIHAAAMFYAINKRAMLESNAISLMPILFFAPWAIFCTLAGYLADRYSKRFTLVFWKIAEVAITLITLLGFWIGSQSGATHETQVAGAWIVLSTVFLMGTHSAFFVPAKYGVLPEILHPSLLSKGNGVLESTSFLAVILGTVSGGVLSEIFKQNEYVIGLILVALAIVGTIASGLIRPVPAANPNRPFPGWAPHRLYGPLVKNLRTLLRAKPLALAVLGIAFFTFMVAFMRQTMYMHGESQNPRWGEFVTSIVVAVVALGIGIGSPLAGSFSGGKIELGLVPWGAVGMILSTLVAGIFIHQTAMLVICLIFVGFFSGFYIVPLYSLLQHRAPKTSKGDLIATSNFINVTGAIAASILFKLLVLGAGATGLSRPMKQQEIAIGKLVLALRAESLFNHRPTKIEIDELGGGKTIIIAEPSKRVPIPHEEEAVPQDLEDLAWQEFFASLIDDLPLFSDEVNNIIAIDDDVKLGSAVALSRHQVRGIDYYRVRKFGNPLSAAYDNEDVPRYLFVGASAMTLAILFLLCRQLPDFFLRAFLWLRSHSRYQTRVLGMAHLPTEEPAILATNCRRFVDCMHVLGCTDRTARFLLHEEAHQAEHTPFLRYLARQAGMLVLKDGASSSDCKKAADAGAKALKNGELAVIGMDTSQHDPVFEGLLTEIRRENATAIIPVYCGVLTEGEAPASPIGRRRIRVVIGEPLPSNSSAEDVRKAVVALGDALHDGRLSDTHHH